MEQFSTYTIFGPITNVTFYLTLGAMLAPMLTMQTRRNLVANGWGVLSESFYATLLNMVETYIGSTIYLPLIYSIFSLILFSNLLGQVPYSSTPTVELVLTLGLSFSLLLGILVLGFLGHGSLLQAHFIPSGTPLGLVFLMVVLEILAYVTRTLSLGLRQAINMVTGHILVKVIVGFIWGAYLKGTSLVILGLGLALLSLFQGLEIQIAYLQAYIFTFITCITFKDMS